MPTHFPWKTAVLVIIVLLVVSCVSFLTYDQVGLRYLNPAADYIVQSLKPGMTRTQVFTVLNHAGPYRIYTDGRGICHTGDANPTEREEVYVHPVWWYRGVVALYMCYDDSGLLTQFWTLD